LKLVI